MSPTRTTGVRLVTLLATFAVVATPNHLRAQRAVKPLSLEDALRVAEAQSEAVQIARAGHTRATGAQLQARSQYLPQIGASVGYTRTLKSQFAVLASSNGGAKPDTAPPASPSLCAPRIPANATPAERQAALAQAITCPKASTNGIDFTKVGFGALNQYAVGLNLSQNVFTAGRITGQNEAANAQVRSAGVEVAAQRAQLALDVTQSYYDAALSDKLVTIAESTLVQTDDVLRQTRLARQVGNQSEFDLLRAQVTRANSLPVLIQRRSDRQVAYLRLKQLLNISLDDSLQLTTPVEDTGAGPILPAVSTRAVVDTTVSDRAPVREMEEAVKAQEGLLRVARAERFPAISVTSGYQRLFFPVSALPQINDFRENWTIGISAAVTLFSGGRIQGDELIAKANLDEARARLQQTRELAALDTRIALNTLTEAEANWRGSQGTAEQASRAYSIDQVRYREGISTQTDLSQSRLLLEQALANRALAARDLAVAKVRLALLRDLPLQASGASRGAASGPTGGSAGAAGAAGGGSPQQQTQQQPRTSTQTGASGTGGQTGGVQP